MVLLGIFFPLLWLVAALMPLCFGESLWVRRAGIAAAGAACCYLILAVVIIPSLMTTRGRYDGGRGYYCDQSGQCYSRG